jgi:hypothetical protein
MTLHIFDFSAQINGKKMLNIEEFSTLLTPLSTLFATFAPQKTKHG